MTFWLLEGEGYGVADYQAAMAQHCAAQIRDWLSAGNRGEALLWKGEQANPVKASDITVLVRSRQEAALIRDALTLLDIPSVYLSNRDSVFDTLEARKCSGCFRRYWRRSAKIRFEARWPALCWG